MRTTLAVAFSASLLLCLSPGSRAELIHYDFSGTAAGLEFGTYHFEGTGPNGEPIIINTSFAWRPGTFDFQFQITVDTEAGPSNASGNGSFEAGDLSLPNGNLLGAYLYDSAPGEGADEFYTYSEDPAAPIYNNGTFHLIDPTGSFFETGNLASVKIWSNIKVVDADSQTGPDYDATGRSVSLAAVPEPSSLVLAAIAGLGMLGAASRARRRPAA